MSFPIGKDKSGSNWDNNNPKALPKQNYDKLEHKSQEAIRDLFFSVSYTPQYIPIPVDPFQSDLLQNSLRQKEIKSYFSEHPIHSQLVQKTIEQKDTVTCFHNKTYLDRIEKAVCCGDLNTLMGLLKPGDPIDEIRIGKKKQSLVHLAVENDQIKVLRFLFKIQPDLKLNEKNAENLTPIESVIYNEMEYEWFGFFIFAGVPFPTGLDNENYFVKTFLEEYHEKRLIKNIRVFSNLVITNIYTFLLEQNQLKTLPQIIYLIPELINIKSEGKTILDKDPESINTFFSSIHLAILEKIYLGENPRFDQSKVEAGKKLLLNVIDVGSLTNAWREMIIKDYIDNHSFLNELIRFLSDDANLQLRQNLKGKLLPAITYATENHWLLAKLALEFDKILSYDESGKNIFHWAVIHGNLDFITKFSSLYEDIPDQLGVTPLITAATCKQEKMVLAFIENGSDLRKTDSNGKSFIDLLEIRKDDGEFLANLDIALKKNKSCLVVLFYNLNKIDFLLSALDLYPSDIDLIFNKMNPFEQTLLYMVQPNLKCFKKTNPEGKRKEIEKFNFTLCDENWLKAVCGNASLEILFTPNFIDYFQKAIKEGSLDTIQLFLDRYIDPRDLTSFLFQAANGNKWEVVEWLLDKYPMLLTETNNQEQSIIFIAIEMRNLPFLKKIIGTSNQIDLLAMEDNQKRNPLEFLLKICPDWLEGLRFLSAKKLEKVISTKNWPATQNLLKLVRERRKHDLKLYPLHLAFKHNSIDIIKRLLEEKEEDFQVLDEKGSTILHYAFSYFPNYEPILLEQLKPIFVSLVNKKDVEGNTPLHLAIKLGEGIAARDMIKMGADVNTQNNLGNTPLHIAASQVIWNNHIELNNIRFLTTRGAGPSRLIKNKEGQTPLHLAAKHGYLINVKDLCDLEETLKVRDNHGKTPLALAVENHNFHLIYLLLNKVVQNSLKGLEGMFPGQILSKPSESEPFESIKDPFGGDFWITEITKKTKIFLTDFCFHDVQFAYNLSKKMTHEDFLKKIDYLKAQFPEPMIRWLVYEKTLREQGYRINPAIYTPQSPIEIPNAPEYADLAYASKTITSMIGRIQNDIPHKPGFINRKIVDIKTQLEVFLTDIQDQKFSETITGKKGTPECDQYYKNLNSLLIHIAILLSGEECPIRKKAQAERQSKNLPPLPLFDNDYCAIVIGEFVKSTVNCGADRAEALIISYELLTKKVEETSSLSKMHQSWEKDILLSIDQYKETVAQWVIQMQKDPKGREIFIGDEKHIGHQVRSYLKARGVKGGEFSKEDKHAKPYITKEKVEFSFDKFFSISGLIELMDEGMNGQIGLDGKRIPIEFGKEKIIDWLIDNFAAPEELQHTQIANQLVAALEVMKDPTKSREEKRKQRKIEETLAKQLGVPEILYKIPSLAYQDAVILAGKTKERIEKEFHLDDTTYEWGFEGIAKILAHPKIGALIKESPMKEAEEKKEE